MSWLSELFSSSAGVIVESIGKFVLRVNNG